MKNLKIDTFSLKVIALIIMVIDHIALYLIAEGSPTYFIMRMIGRIAAPIFMYCFAVGYSHTRDRGKYIVRLAIATICVGILNLVMDYIHIPGQDYTIVSPNMFFTFLLSSFAISAMEKVIKEKSYEFALPAITISVIIGLYAEYGWIALFTILCFYFIKNETFRNILFIVGSMTLCIIEQNFVQIFMILAILPIAYASNKKPKHRMKYFFYFFYPLHTFVLAIIKLLWF